jgi:hypothetical protein
MEAYMKYALLCYGDERGWDTLNETQQRRIIEDTRQNTDQMKSGGNYLSAAALLPTTMATSVRVRDGKRVVTDGPFAETKEQLGGFCLIEAKDLEEAIEIAARHPAARSGWGTVEIRPVKEIHGLPSG